MADDEDEDSVVAEVDVYLAQTLANNLYLFQYPVRPVDLTYDNVPHIGARVKPEQKKVEFDLAINTNSANYYTPRGEQIALDVGGSARLTASEGKDSFYTSDMMDKQVLTSSQASQDVSRYAVGVLKEGELHLSPIHGVLQLRPSFEYLNKGEENVRQASNVNDEGESQDEEEEAKPLTVKFARRETDRAKAQRLSSFKYLEQKKAEEQWKNVEFYNPQDDIAAAERGFLYCQEMDYESPEFRVEPREYLKLLTPSATEEERSQPQLPNNVLSMTQLRTMDLPDQVKALLINAKVITFQQLCTLLSPVAKEASVLRCVQQYGVLVQGCWVVKSELLYPEGSISPTSGVAADILCKGRDYLLWRFNQNRVVVRKDIKSITKLPNEDIKEMLEQVSRMRVALGWEFVLPYNLEFIQKHPDIYKQQLTMWEAKYQMLQKQLNLPKQEKITSESKKAAIADTINSSDKKPSKSKSKTNHVMNHDMESSLPAPEEHSPMEVDCKEVASQDMSNEIKKEPLSPKSEHLFDALKVLQDFVHEKLHRTVLSFADFKKLLLLRQTASTPGDPLCSGVPDVVLEKAILAAGATEVDFKWPTSALQNDLQSRRLFAFRSVGDSADQHRAVLLDMFRNNWFVTKRDFSSRATQETDSAPGKKVWATLQQDLLERVGNKYTHWYLRGTAAMLNSV